MYLRQAYQFGSRQKFQTLHKSGNLFFIWTDMAIKDVSIAAKTLSANVAAAIESVID